jgi:hypothetical protein
MESWPNGTITHERQANRVAVALLRAGRPAVAISWQLLLSIIFHWLKFVGGAKSVCGLFCVVRLLPGHSGLPALGDDVYLGKPLTQATFDQLIPTFIRQSNEF